MDQADSANVPPQLTTILNKVKVLSTEGTLANEAILEQRLCYIWKSSDSTNRTTAYRHRQVCDKFERIQDKDNHLFLAVILALPTTSVTLKSFDTCLYYLLNLEDYSQFHFTLRQSDRRSIQSIATKHDFTSSDRYKLLLAIYPPDPQPQNQQPTPLNEDAVAQSQKRQPTPLDEDADIPTPKRQQNITALSKANQVPLPKISTDPNQIVIEHASIEGIAKIFNKDTCDEIKKISVGGVETAAVTTILPTWGGDIDCYISVLVSQLMVSRLAKELFGIEVKWTVQTLHVVLKDGTVIIPKRDVTLRGGLATATNRVLSPCIYDAIEESRIRTQEKEKEVTEHLLITSSNDEFAITMEGDDRTKCVSMILTKGEGIVNLSLGIVGGTSIHKELHAFNEQVF